MYRLPRSAGALLLTTVLCLTTSTGPATADDTGPITTTEPAITSTEPTPPSAEPEVEPTAEPTEPVLVPTEPATSTEPTATTTGTAVAEPVAPVPDPVPTTSTAPEPGRPSVDLRVAVAFDKTSYTLDETITASVSITNAGATTASPARLELSGSLSWNAGTWDPVGVPIGPGETSEGHLVGSLSAPDDVQTIVVTVGTEVEDANPADNTATASVLMTIVRGTLAGTVYGDADGNGAVDAGEGLVGIYVSVTWSRRDLPYMRLGTVTDANGRFVFERAPSGDYALDVHSEQWHFPSAVRWYFAGVDDPDVLVRGIAPFGRSVTAAVAFDRATYGQGDVARLTITLTNGGERLLSDVRAFCAGQVPLDLGDLSPEGRGAILPPGSTRVFRVPFPVDAMIARQGYMRVKCILAVSPGTTGQASGEAIARVPGLRVAKAAGTLVSYLVRPHKGGVFPTRPIPWVKVYLRDQVTGAVIARATTGASGWFAFYDVPVGLHDFGVVGPWVPVFGGDEFTVTAGWREDWPRDVHVEAGEHQPDPDPPLPPAAGPPNPPVGPAASGTAGGSAAGLAATGVDVTWLALGGLVAFVLGALLVLGVRRGVL
ncbi:hypothetical protein [Saccharothrix sp. Mg75]|uniref:hypothetical protein n=1 Tax=Saccharothrix sp. Mg75 TaxID=3445357 RepID=UPI003EEC1189